MRAEFLLGTKFGKVSMNSNSTKKNNEAEKSRVSTLSLVEEKHAKKQVQWQINTKEKGISPCGVLTKLFVPTILGEDFGESPSYILKIRSKGGQSRPHFCKVNIVLNLNMSVRILSFNSHI